MRSLCQVSLGGFSLSPSFPPLFLPPEDGSGDGISTISGSRNPLQPADTSSEEPFTTYFDSKIPIPEDETVGASPAGNGVEKGLQALGAGVGYVGSVPQEGLQARPGVNDSSQVIWLRSCQRAEKSLGYKPEGGEVGSLFPYQGKGAHKNGALSPSWSTGVTFQLHLPAGFCLG